MQINAVNAIPETSGPHPVKTEPFEKPKIEARRAERADDSNNQSEHLEKLKTALADRQISLKYSLDEETKTLVVRMVDEKTGEAVRQLPSEVSLKLAAEYIKMQGVFVNEQVAE
jgi:flagellar protein FlaG